MSQSSFQHRVTRCAALCVLATSPLVSSPVLACMGTPPPQCARTLNVSLAGPDVLIGPAGQPINFDLPVLVYLNVLEFPPGACGSLIETATAEVSVLVDADCAVAPGSGSLGPINLGTGFSTLTVPVELPAGPARQCILNGSAAATFGDGVTLTASSDNTVCVGDQAPADPAAPRLDMRNLDASIVKRVHPGDQASYTYRITNNDPNESYSGKLSVSLINTSRLPVSSAGPGTPQDGPFSISDPVQGDNFPLGFAEDLVNGCLYLPEDHAEPLPSTLNKFIDLAPGESTDVDIYARPFGLCAGGSCSASVVILEGEFSDLSNGLACVGFVTAADTAVAPSLEWAQGGMAATASAPGPGLLQLDVPTTLLPSMFTALSGGSLFIDGNQVTPDFEPFSTGYDGSIGRIGGTLGSPGVALANAGAPFSVESLLGLSPAFPAQMTIDAFHPTAPTGFAQTAPGSVVTLGFEQTPGAGKIAFMDLATQFSMTVTWDDGSQSQVQFDEVAIGEGPFPGSLSFIASGNLPALEGLQTIELITENIDLRAFSRLNADFDTDGITDDLDDCILEPDAAQIDTDEDGFGNACDGDFNNDCIVNFADLAEFKMNFMGTDPEFDLTGEGLINFGDLAKLKKLFLKPPGPSANEPCVPAGR